MLKRICSTRHKYSPTRGTAEAWEKLFIAEEKRFYCKYTSVENNSSNIEITNDFKSFINWIIFCLWNESRYRFLHTIQHVGWRLLLGKLFTDNLRQNRLSSWHQVSIELNGCSDRQLLQLLYLRSRCHGTDKMFV